MRSCRVRDTKDRINIGILQPRFLVSLLYWTLGPESQILVCVRSLGPIMISIINSTRRVQVPTYEVSTQISIYHS